mgnify:CR=1 FL=1
MNRHLFLSLLLALFASSTLSADTLNRAGLLVERYEEPGTPADGVW